MSAMAFPIPKAPIGTRCISALAILLVRFDLCACKKSCEDPSCSISAGESLLQVKTAHGKAVLKAYENSPLKTGGCLLRNAHSKIAIEDLTAAEQCFMGPRAQADHGDVGGDRMGPKMHNYAPIYARHLASLLLKNVTPTIVETGILTGTGLAMWSQLFPNSRIYGFDKNTATYHGHLSLLKTQGFDDSRVVVQQMDQMQNNTGFLERTFRGNAYPNILVDDGLHTPEAGIMNFLSFEPVLASHFVYFIEDIYQSDPSVRQRWELGKVRILEKCTGCKFQMECPQPSIKPECIAVISRL
eukprot:gnl/TRDRNA2_/TRDRNA2_160642_c0_seq2.p1 gnl/TRDRNA2_/TRDRNA2_160642_c0~~gnl/TRDRNA2_/TRDRNA2_160642_c0_seq2.p1  ORF type:complete len:299 (+),score=31.37 gnl/TRDRNA2_/TRDRNA2_160642_c0_seq2:33-929(+)